MVSFLIFYLPNFMCQTSCVNRLCVSRARMSEKLCLGRVNE
uniref:Uncharacterized protein n=1 Tax=Anguilla anguilla TaxID=7936 RepID=A0A0E9ULI2_ANGAN